MRSNLRKRIAGAAAAAVLALGLGVVPASALDAPTAAVEVECATRACNEIGCDRSCKGRFGPFASGFCGEDGVCRCAL